MIVDDQEFTSKLISGLVRVLGARDIRIFSDAENAWKDMSLKVPDIILLDWEMKPISGLTFTNRIRKSDDSPNAYMPIIMVTAHREQDHVFMAREAGVNEYIIKPISPKVLFSRIQMVIENPRKFIRVGDFFGPDRRRTSKEVARSYKGDLRRKDD